jgi:hypothetical protein
MFTKDERATIVAALECYRREQVRLSVTLWRKNQITQAQRLDKATGETKAIMDKVSMMRPTDTERQG